MEAPLAAAVPQTFGRQYHTLILPLYPCSLVLALVLVHTWAQTTNRQLEETNDALQAGPGEAQLRFVAISANRV